MAKKVQDSRAFAKAKNKASEYANDAGKLNDLIDKASKKADSKRNGPLADVWDTLMILSSQSMVIKNDTSLV